MEKESTVEYEIKHNGRRDKQGKQKTRCRYFAIYRYMCKYICIKRILKTMTKSLFRHGRLTHHNVLDKSDWCRKSICHTPNELFMMLQVHGWSGNGELQYDVYQELHDDVIKWKHLPRHWPFVRGNHRSPVTSPHKGQWRGALMFSLICVWINGCVNNREAGDLRRYRPHYDAIVIRNNIIAVHRWCGTIIFHQKIYQNMAVFCFPRKCIWRARQMCWNTAGFLNVKTV